MLKTPNSELNRLTVEAFKTASKTPIIIVLDNIRSLNNIGSVFRTSDAFLLEAIYLCGITATPPHRDIQKTALGATETVSWTYFNRTEEAVLNLKTNGYRILAVEQANNSTMLHKIDLKSQEKIALVFGNEVKGVEQDIMNICDECIEIPQLGTKHSLNISVSVGILVWECVKKISVL